MKSTDGQIFGPFSFVKAIMSPIAGQFSSFEVFRLSLTFLSWYSNRQKLVISDGSADSSECFGISIDLVFLVRVWYLLVVGAIASRILPVNV